MEGMGNRNKNAWISVFTWYEEKRNIYIWNNKAKINEIRNISHADPERFRFARDTSFGRRHLSFWSRSSILLWVVRQILYFCSYIQLRPLCFCLQCWSSWFPIRPTKSKVNEMITHAYMFMNIAVAENLSSILLLPKYTGLFLPTIYQVSREGGLHDSAPWIHYCESSETTIC